jgi:hypothetical protein
MKSPVLARLTLTFELDGLTARILYCHGGADPGPGTVACRREVAGLTRDGLVRALKALRGGPVEYLGANDFQIREDFLALRVASVVSERLVRYGAV